MCLIDRRVRIGLREWVVGGARYILLFTDRGWWRSLSSLWSLTSWTIRAEKGWGRNNPSLNLLAQKRHRLILPIFHCWEFVKWYHLDVTGVEKCSLHLRNISILWRRMWFFNEQVADQNRPKSRPLWSVHIVEGNW